MIKYLKYMLSGLYINTIYIFGFVILIILSSCSNTGELKISVHADTEFPVISMSNLSGKYITIHPVSADKGSIGFEKEGKITWIKGKPNEETVANGMQYIWNNDDGCKFVMQTNIDKEDILFRFSIENSEILPDKWYVNLKSTEKEYFTGIFERVVDGNQRNSWKDGITTAMNLRGQRVEMKLKPTVSAYAPFYLSSSNYGFFVKGTWPGVFDFCKEHTNTLQISFEGSDLSFKIYRGTSPLQIVQKHALETGPSFVPPEWAFGQWRWRDEHRNRKVYYDSTEVNAPYNSDLVEDILMMSALDIPFTAYWIDRPWGPGKRGFDDYKFDTQRIPGPEGMIKWLNSKGIELMLWIGPFVMGEMADYAEENNFDLVSKRWKNSRQVLMDFTNPEACKWWGENGPAKLARMGIKGYKLDRADGEKLTDSLHLNTFIGTSYRENYNDYPRQYVKATYDAIKPVLGDDFILFPRAQYSGSAKYGSLWAGDTNGKAEGLRSAIIGMQRCAIMGYPVWGSDIGGYWGSFSHETCMRWIGFGCFSPIMEIGPTENKGFWDNVDEPHYDTTLIATWRLYAKVRPRLIPYIHSLAKKAATTGTPIARPLFLIYPEQKEAWEDWCTYLLGPDILVSIIWETGKRKHKLYLPSGEDWTDAWNTDETYNGGKYIEVDAPVYKIPVFIRKGSDIKLGNLNELYHESLEIASQKPDLAELERKEGWRK